MINLTILIGSLLFSFKGFAGKNCGVEGRLAPVRAGVTDRSLDFGAQLSDVQEEAENKRRAGAICTEINQTGGLYVLTSYYPILQGSHAGKLSQHISIMIKMNE